MKNGSLFLIDHHMLTIFPINTLGAICFAAIFIVDDGLQQSASCGFFSCNWLFVYAHILINNTIIYIKMSVIYHLSLPFATQVVNFQKKLRSWHERNFSHSLVFGNLWAMNFDLVMLLMWSSLTTSHIVHKSYAFHILSFITS